ncbi:hypothetical protein KPH14_006350 [Odynerus spinipes]|uniref:Uncharacterized protein n=1 Tax=Odynerus spinipes TaxID=1348599 RepID=A0AAD9S0J4_9HYME|nr:hypothetical protein KPH14_006350 [Odynerus spinipes]
MLEYIFTYTTLCQLMISGILLCVAGFQVFLSRGTLIRKMIFILHTTGCFFQLFVITMTANEILVASEAVGDGAYSTNWSDMPTKTFGKIKGALLMIMIRSKQPCYITAGGFFPVTLETFMAVLSTAASYFTLLRKFDDDLT